GWQKEIHVWPFLLRIEFLAAIIVTIVLMIWSITLYAPLEEPSNPNLTMNPAKAPWYFLGLQEMLVYFDPWIAGVVMPTLIIIGRFIMPALCRRYNPKECQRMSLLQYSIMQFFMLTMVALPIKILLRLLFHIKYLCITPWFNV